jgi:hypothetical protein
MQIQPPHSLVGVISMEVPIRLRHPQGSLEVHRASFRLVLDSQVLTHRKGLTHLEYHLALGFMHHKGLTHLVRTRPEHTHLECRPECRPERHLERNIPECVRQDHLERTLLAHLVLSLQEVKASLLTGHQVSHHITSTSTVRTLDNLTLGHMDMDLLPAILEVSFCRLVVPHLAD